MGSFSGENTNKTDSSCSHDFPCPLTTSPIRSQILAESINANRVRPAKPQQRPRWTRVSYDGYQSTLDLRDSLKPLRPSKVRKAGHEPRSFTRGSKTGPPNSGKESTHLHGQHVTDFQENSWMETDPLTSTMMEPVLGDNGNNEYYGEKDPDGLHGCGHVCNSLPWLCEPVDLEKDPMMLELEDLEKAFKANPEEHSSVFTPKTYDHPKLDSESLLKPISQTISQEQLTAEVKSIYRGLVLLETECMLLDKASDPNDPHFLDDSWDYLITLHRTLLQEHHDLFLVSQHPSASPALRRLAQKYSMPARMWDNAISSFLELLRYPLPGTQTSRLANMAEFLQSVQLMMNSLQESLPSMADDWLKILNALQEYQDTLQQQFSKSMVNPVGECNPAAQAPKNSSSDWYNPHRGQRDERENPDQPGVFLEATSWLPQYIIDTMSGWLYYGQAIAPSFDVFVKVFVAISLAAHQRRYSCWKLW